ncbi:IS66 family insertion sequence element accessory protein TnpB [Paraburkholderia phymatum]|uniref:IS66 family insertion sequence element accessory protein TnpB n=1 Tax=Paraburkholderia phymatum TaxID=148447 RepID=UPI003D17F95D
MRQQQGSHSEVCYKRLEKGRFIWPQADSGVICLSPAQLSMLLEGIDWRQPKRTARPTSAL